MDEIVNKIIESIKIKCSDCPCNEDCTVLSYGICYNEGIED